MDKHVYSIVQEEDIMRIADTAVHTTENIKDANEEIREVMWGLNTHYENLPSNTQRYFCCKNENFRLKKKKDILNIFIQNIDFAYRLEPTPRRF